MGLNCFGEFLRIFGCSYGCLFGFGCGLAHYCSLLLCTVTGSKNAQKNGDDVERELCEFRVERSAVIQRMIHQSKRSCRYDTWSGTTFAFSSQDFGFCVISKDPNPTQWPRPTTAKDLPTTERIDINKHQKSIQALSYFAASYYRCAHLFPCGSSQIHIIIIS